MHIILFSLLPAALASTCTDRLPLLSYSFTATDCATGTFYDDISETFALDRNLTGTACLSHNGFPYAKNGVQLVNNPTSHRRMRSRLPIDQSNLLFMSEPYSPVRPFTIEFIMSYGDGDLGSGSFASLLGIHSPTTFIDSSLSLSFYYQELRAYYAPQTVDTYLGPGVDPRGYADNLYLGNLQAINSPTFAAADLIESGVPVYYAIVFNGPAIASQFIDPGGPGFINVTMYLGNPGTGAVKSTYDEFTYSQVKTSAIFPSTYYLHVGEAVDLVTDFSNSLNGTFHHLAFFDTAFADADVLARVSMNLANAVPSSIDASLSLLQHSTPQLIPFDLATYTYDDDGDAITSLVIQTLPARGQLYHQGVAITTTGIAVTDLTNFTYNANNATAYTIRNDTNCTSAGAFTSFTIKVTDALGTSVQASTVYICLVDVYDIPIVQDQTVGGIRLGNLTHFTLILVDPDDFYTPLSSSRLRDAQGNFTTTASVYFPTVVGLYGYLSSTNGSLCNEADVLIPNQLYTPILYQGTEQFLFCYVTNATTWGNDVFTAEVIDTTGFESAAAGIITFPVLNPLEACDSLSATSCLASTTEHPDYLSITLQGRDWFEDGVRGGLRYRLVTLPTYGTLFYINGSTRVPITALEENATTSFDGVLDYQPDVGYYNRLDGTTFVDLNGVGFYGCLVLVAPGCPDSFTYVVLLEYANGTDLLVSDEAGTFTIYVESEYTVVTSITAPTPITVYMNQTYYFTGEGNTISIQDYDTDLHWIGVELTTNEDYVGFDATPQEYRTSNYYWSECTQGVELAVCNRVVFFSTLSYANAMLARTFLHSDTGVRNLTSKLTVYVYKPNPPLTFDEGGLIVGEDDILDSPQKTKVIYMINGNSTGSNGGGSTLLYTIILFGGVAGALILSCVACCGSIASTCTFIPAAFLYLGYVFLVGLGLVLRGMFLTTKWCLCGSRTSAKVDTKVN